MILVGAQAPHVGRDLVLGGPLLDGRLRWHRRQWGRARAPANEWGTLAVEGTSSQWLVALMLVATRCTRLHPLACLPGTTHHCPGRVRGGEGRGGAEDGVGHRLVHNGQLGVQPRGLLSSNTTREPSWGR